jgi:protein-S-isoprenylcysteine O-methyltransferase Ste14
MFRWLMLAVLVGALSVSGYHRAHARRHETIARRREGSFLVTLRAIVSLILFGAVLLHIVRPGWMTWGSFDAPAGVRWAGAILGVLTIPAVYWVLGTLGPNVSETVLTKEHHELVLLLLRLFVIPREEQALLEKFGGRYQEYKDRTGRLVPRLRGTAPAAG